MDHSAKERASEQRCKGLCACWRSRRKNRQLRKDVRTHHRRQSEIYFARWGVDRKLPPPCRRPLVHVLPFCDWSMDVAPPSAAFRKRPPRKSMSVVTPPSSVRRVLQPPKRRLKVSTPCKARGGVWTGIRGWASWRLGQHRYVGVHRVERVLRNGCVIGVGDGILELRALFRFYMDDN